VRTSTSQTRTKAFTLVELVVVLMLLSVVIAVAGPRLSGFFAGRNYQEDARRILSLFRYARAEAINRGQRVEVWFDPKTSSYGAQSDPTDPQNNPVQIEYTLQEGLALKVDTQVLDKDGRATILCWPDGAIDPDSPGRIELWEGEKPFQVLTRLDTGMDYALENPQNVTAEP